MREIELMRHLEGAKASLDRALQALEAGNIRPQAALEAARDQLRILELRNAAFPAAMFGDYRWSILLVLYVAHEEDREVRQADVFKEAGVPHTTGKRIIDELGDLNLVEVRQGNSARAKRFIKLRSEGLDQMKGFFSTT